MPACALFFSFKKNKAYAGKQCPGFNPSQTNQDLLTTNQELHYYFE